MSVMKRPIGRTVNQNPVAKQGETGDGEAEEEFEGREVEEGLESLLALVESLVLNGVASVSLSVHR